MMHKQAIKGVAVLVIKRVLFLWTKSKYGDKLFPKQFILLMNEVLLSNC